MNGTKMIDFLKWEELDTSEYNRSGEDGVCANCGCDVDPDDAYELAGLCRRCAAEVDAKLKAFLRTFDKHELLHIDDVITSENVWELAEREMYTGESF